MGTLDLWGLLFIGKFKASLGEFKPREGKKTSGPNGQLLKSTKISETKELGDEGWLFI